MRYVTFRLVPDGAALNAVEARLADEPAVTREAMHHIRILEDDTGVLLVELAGDPDAAEAVFEAHADVIAHSVSRAGDRLFAHVHQEFPGEVGELLGIQQRYGLIVDPPMEYADGGSVLVTAVGERRTIREALAEIPEAVGVEIEAVGEYRPGAERLFEKLTERQREAVAAAQRLGYFDDPRRATYEDIAGVLDCRPETVGEHLRKAQATVFAEVVPR